MALAILIMFFIAWLLLAIGSFAPSDVATKIGFVLGAVAAGLQLFTGAGLGV